MRALFAVLLALVLPACSTISSNPIAITCTGKGTITGTGYAGANAGVGGQQANLFTLTADCGDKGFTYTQGAPPK